MRSTSQLFLLGRLPAPDHTGRARCQPPDFRTGSECCGCGSDRPLYR